MAGQPKKIKSPEKLLELFEAYKAEVKSKPFLVHDFAGKDVVDVYRAKEKPLTMVGFEVYVCKVTEVQYPDLTNYFENTNGGYEEYLPITTRIRAEIKEDQISGGMSGIYNPNLTARINGISDKTESKVTTEQPLFPDVSADNGSK